MCIRDRVYGGHKGVQGYCADRAERTARDDDSNAFMRAAADGNLDGYNNGARATAPATSIDVEPFVCFGAESPAPTEGRRSPEVVCFPRAELVHWVE